MALLLIVWHFSPGLARQAGHSKSIGFNIQAVYSDWGRVENLPGWNGDGG